MMSLGSRYLLSPLLGSEIFIEHIILGYVILGHRQRVQKAWILCTCGQSSTQVLGTLFQNFLPCPCPFCASLPTSVLLQPWKFGFMIKSERSLKQRWMTQRPRNWNPSWWRGIKTCRNHEIMSRREVSQMIPLSSIWGFVLACACELKLKHPETGLQKGSSKFQVSLKRFFF